MRSQSLAKHKGEDLATSVSSNMQTLMIQADKQCLDLIHGIIVEYIEKRIPCEASVRRVTADRREEKGSIMQRIKKNTQSLCKRKWYAANKEKVIKNVRKWQAANIDKHKEYGRRSYARRRLAALYKEVFASRSGFKPNSTLRHQRLTLRRNHTRT